MIDQSDMFEYAALALRQAAVKGVESFVSQAVGQTVQITSGPAGQVVVGPNPPLPNGSNAPASANRILMPLLVGSAVLYAIGALTKE